LLYCERCQHHAPLAWAIAVIPSGRDASIDVLRAPEYKGVYTQVKTPRY
jgi:hypothetical protein